MLKDSTKRPYKNSVLDGKASIFSMKRIKPVDNSFRPLFGLVSEAILQGFGFAGLDTLLIG